MEGYVNLVIHPSSNRARCRATSMIEIRDRRVSQAACAPQTADTKNKLSAVEIDDDLNVYSTNGFLLVAGT